MKTKKVKLAQRLPSNLCSQQPQEGGKAPHCQLLAASWGLAEASLAIRSLCLWGLLFLDSASTAVGKTSRAFSDPPPQNTQQIHACHWGPAKVSGSLGRRMSPKFPLLCFTGEDTEAQRGPVGGQSEGQGPNSNPGLVTSRSRLPPMWGAVCQTPISQGGARRAVTSAAPTPSLGTLPPASLSLRTI